MVTPSTETLSPPERISPDGNFRLAVAVLLQAMRDAQHGPDEVRDQVRAAIRHSELDHWIDAVSYAAGTYSRLKRMLSEL